MSADTTAPTLFDSITGTLPGPADGRLESKPSGPGNAVGPSVARAKDLHLPFPSASDPDAYCLSCTTGRRSMGTKHPEYMPWPCPTFAALEMVQTPPTTIRVACLIRYGDFYEGPRVTDYLRGAGMDVSEPELAFGDIGGFDAVVHSTGGPVQVVREGGFFRASGGGTVVVQFEGGQKNLPGPYAYKGMEAFSARVVQVIRRNIWGRASTEGGSRSASGLDTTAARPTETRPDYRHEPEGTTDV